MGYTKKRNEEIFIRIDCWEFIIHFNSPGVVELLVVTGRDEAQKYSAPMAIFLYNLN